MSLKLATRTLAREEKNGLQYVRVRVTKKKKEKKGIRCVLGEI